jgi:hypothetical protein
MGFKPLTDVSTTLLLGTLDTTVLIKYSAYHVSIKNADLRPKLKIGKLQTQREDQFLLTSS